MGLRLGSQTDFLYMNHRLAFSRVMDFFALLVTVFSVIHDFTYGGLGIGRHFNQIQTDPFRIRNSLLQGNNAQGLSFLINDSDRSRLYFSVDP